MGTLYFVLFSIALLTRNVSGYGDGIVPIDACSRGPYGHGVPVQNTLAPYRIEVYHASDNTSAADYTAGETLRGEYEY